MSGSLSAPDSSIPLQAGKGITQPNPLATIGEFAQIKNAINQNALFPGQQQIQRGNIALQNQGIQGGQVDLQNKINQSVYGSGVPLLAKPPGSITHDDVTTWLGSAEKNLGLPTNGVIGHILATSPTGDGPEFDAKVRSLIAAGAQPSQNAAGQVTPQTGPIIDNGPQLQPTTVTPAGAPSPGVVSPAGGSYGKGLGPQFVSTGAGMVPTNNGAPTGTPPIANQLSPAQLATPTQIGVDQKTGAPIMGTLGQFLSKTGAASPLGTGRLPPALLNPANAQQSQGVVTGVGPAQQAQMAAQGGQSAHAFQDIADQGVQARSQNAVLGNMLGDIANFTPGPTGANNFKNWVVRNGAAIGTTFGLDPASVAANESFDKLANQIAGAQGERSDARLSVAQAANPGSHLSPAGADLILRQLQGNSDYLQARAKLASQYPNQTDRAGFEAEVGSTLDPRAFQYDRMTPVQRKTYAAGLSPQDLSAVRSSYNKLHGEGLLGGQ